MKPFNTPPPSLDDQVDIDQLKTELLANEGEFHWRKLDDTEIYVESYEYLAFQKLPLFGAHFFYAYSPHEPIQEWKNVDKILDRKNMKIFREIEEMGEELRNQATTSKATKKLGAKKSTTVVKSRRGQ